MPDAATLKIIALIGAIIVGGTALVQLKNDWTAKGIDATVTRILLGLMAFGCVLALAAGAASACDYMHSASTQSSETTAQAAEAQPSPSEAQN